MNEMVHNMMRLTSKKIELQLEEQLGHFFDIIVEYSETEESIIVKIKLKQAKK